MKIETAAYEINGELVLNEISLWVNGDYAEFRNCFPSYAEFRNCFPSAVFQGIDDLGYLAPKYYEHWTLRSTNIRIRV